MWFRSNRNAQQSSRPATARRYHAEELEQRRLLSGLPTISIGDVSIAEGDAGQSAFVFTVSLSQASSKPVSVKFATSAGSARSADGDYAAASGTLKFAKGETTKTITVLVNGDATLEPD